MNIDVNRRFDIDYLDKGLDPDKYNPELKKYHKILWSKKLPCGRIMNLNVDKSKNRLYFDEFTFNPDSIVHSFKHTKRKYNGQYEEDIIDSYEKSDPEIKKLLDDYSLIDYVIGASIIFPLNGDDNKTGWTINRARGMSYMIHDRIDYTLECIKRFYLNKEDITNPLYKSLIRYSHYFFDLFINFENFVNFYFLNDLVDESGNIISFTETIDFNHPFPIGKGEYKKYIKSVIQFVNNRSERIKRWALDSGYSVL